jgi:methanogenic corrinoid protein MtbC1
LKHHISPKELGRAVGASESSLKRWTDEGLLRAVRTAGGHRRIAIDEAVRFIRDTGLALVAPDAMGLPDLTGLVPVDAGLTPAQALAAAMIHGNAPRVRGLVLRAYLAGQTVAGLFDRLITPALHDIGELWRHDAKGIFIEHRATSMCLDAINQVRSLLPPAAANAPLAIGAALSGDIYAIPSLMAAATLAADGWREMNLGPDTPAASLLLAAHSARPRLVWVSVSTPHDDSELLRQLERLAGELSELNARLIVGGRGAPGRLRHSNAHVAGSMSELAAYAAGIKSAT